MIRYVIMHEHGTVQLKLYPDYQEQIYSTAYLYALWVDEDHRREHIATLLLDKAEELAKADGHKSIALEWSLEEAPREIAWWYARRGYDEKEFGNTCALMVKDL